MAPIDLLSTTYTLIARASGSGSGGGGGRGGSSSSSSSGGSRSGGSRSGSSSSGSKGYSGGGGGGSGKGGNPNAWVKFGKHWVRRWQFGLIVTAIVLAGIALLVVAFMVWRRKHGKKVAVTDNREWGKYMAGLRKKNANDGVVGGEGGGVGAKEMSSDSESDEEKRKTRDSGVGVRV